MSKTSPTNDPPLLQKHSVSGCTFSSEVYMMDCIQGMKEYPDKYFDLAVVDPPYGIGEDGGKCRTRKKHNNVVKHSKKNWDLSIPEMQYFTELFRVSKNQIIWGANYFTQFLPSSMGWIYWDKKIGGDFRYLHRRSS